MHEIRHRFAAILAADVAHYSRLMESNSEATVRALQQCRSIFEHCVSQHHGREFGSVGDSLMAEFAGPVEALRAARDIQAAIGQTDAICEGGETLRIRIGLHAGDVLSDGDNLFGDVINTASRLQAIAESGGIVLSRFVYRQVRNEPGFSFHSLGRQQLKNIQEPVHVYEIVEHVRAFSLHRLRLTVSRYKPALAATLGVLVAALLFVVYLETRDRQGISGTIEVPDDNSIAILPFSSQDLLEDEGTFFDGIHGEILMQLAKLGSLDRVISRGSIERYRDTTLSIREIGSELEVAKILAGTVLIVDGGVRISVELIDALNDGHIWAESYERELDSVDMTAIPSIIARDIASAMNIAVSGSESAQLDSVPTTNIEAYGEFMLGHSEMLRLTPQSLKKAEDHFRKAADLDPEFALAYVGIADALRLLPKYDYFNSETSIPERQALVTKALRIDPDAGPAHASLATIQAEQGDAESAEESFLAAIELSPNYALAHLWYGDFLATLGRHDESLASIHKALEIDPTAPPIKMSLAARLRWMGNVDDAIQVLLDGVEETPDFPEYYPELVTNYGMTGRFAQSLRWADAGRDVAPHHQNLKGLRCLVFKNLGDFDATERCYRSIEKDFPVEYVSAQVELHLLRDEREQAAAIVEENINHPEARLFFRWRLASFYLELGEPEKYLEFVREVDPSRLDISIEYAPEDMVKALQLAFALYETGDRDRANQLFDRYIEIIDEFLEDYQGTQSFPVAMPAVLYVLALREDRTKLIEALRNFVDSGWRRGWLGLKSRYFDFVRDDPEFVELMNRLEEHVANEWQLYEELKD